ncbi:MAG: TraR/DksA C4-type zinc finger protein [Neptuniibacter sp.]
MDVIDHAKELELKQRQIALDKTLKNASEPQQEIIDGVVICIACGIDIPPARLAAKPNAARCIDCQQIEEQKHGR